MNNWVALLLKQTITSSTPIVLAAMGGLFTEHAGIMNIGMDGMMLMSAFCAAVCSWLFQSALIGLAAGLLIGILVGLFFGLFVIRLKSDEFIIGVALNLFAGALTVFLLRSLFVDNNGYPASGTFAGQGGTSVIGLPDVKIPFICDIPFVGDVIGKHSILVYISWVMVVLSYILIYKTPFGFRLRASGEMPDSLKSLGKSPVFMKYAASVICGIMCGLAGAHLSLGYLTKFIEGMSAEKGFIAFACIIFGKANPPKVWLAVLLFGFLDALGLKLQGQNISSDLTNMMPYLATIFVLIIAAFRDRAKRAKNRDLVQKTS